MLRFSCAVGHVYRQFRTVKVVIQTDTGTSYIIQGKRKDKKGDDIKGRMKSQKIELRSENDRIIYKYWKISVSSPKKRFSVHAHNRVHS